MELIRVKVKLPTEGKVCIKRHMLDLESSFLPHSHSCSYSLILTLSHSLTLTLTLSPILSHSHTHILSLIIVFFFFFRLKLLLCASVVHQVCHQLYDCEIQGMS